MEQEEEYVKAVVYSFLSGKPFFLSPSSSTSKSSDRISALSSDVAFFFVFLGRQYEYVRGVSHFNTHYVVWVLEQQLTPYLL